MGDTNLFSPMYKAWAARYEAACVGWYKSQNKYSLRFEQKLAVGVHVCVPDPQQAVSTSFKPEIWGFVVIYLHHSHR